MQEPLTDDLTFQPPATIRRVAVDFRTAVIDGAHYDDAGRALPCSAAAAAAGWAQRSAAGQALANASTFDELYHRLSRIHAAAWPHADAGSQPATARSVAPGYVATGAHESPSRAGVHNGMRDDREACHRAAALTHKRRSDCGPSPGSNLPAAGSLLPGARRKRTRHERPAQPAPPWRAPRAPLPPELMQQLVAPQPGDDDRKAIALTANCMRVALSCGREQLGDALISRTHIDALLEQLRHRRLAVDPASDSAVPASHISTFMSLASEMQARRPAAHKRMPLNPQAALACVPHCMNHICCFQPRRLD